jgi:hypothetical protein
MGNGASEPQELSPTDARNVMIVDWGAQRVPGPILQAVPLFFSTVGFLARRLNAYAIPLSILWI